MQKQKQTTTENVGEPVWDERQQGPVVAIRILPHGEPIVLDAFVGPNGPERVLTVGRNPENNIIAQTNDKNKDKSVSWLHCLLIREGNRVFVKDAGELNTPRKKTSNGTWVDTVQVKGTHTEELRAGQILWCGKVRLLACNGALEECPANITATDLAGFLESASETYGKSERTGDALGVAGRTLRDWARTGRFRSKRKP